MAMSKKDYVAVAKELKLLVQDIRVNGEAKDAVRETIKALAEDFGDDNPRFDREKFLAACGVA